MGVHERISRRSVLRAAEETRQNADHLNHILSQLRSSLLELKHDLAEAKDIIQTFAAMPFWQRMRWLLLGRR